MSANRKIRPEVQRVFEKYVSNNLARRMTKKEAMHMLEDQYNLKTHQAEEFFKHFDADKNDHLSLWEFQHFCSVVGERASEIAIQFEELDTTNTGFLSREELLNAIKSVSDGRALDEKEVNFFLTTTLGENEAEIDLGKFADFLMRLKIYQKRKSSS